MMRHMTSVYFDLSASGSSTIPHTFNGASPSMSPSLSPLSPSLSLFAVERLKDVSGSE